MPFTFSHPAAVLPLLPLRLVPSALVIGSMMPDLPYYTPGIPISSVDTHAASGIITLDLVLGVLVFAVWHVLLTPALTAFAPAALRDRLAPDLPVPARHHVRNPLAVVVVVVSLIIGAATHVVWDSFTHADRWGTDRIGWLREEHGPFAGHTWAQYTSGVVGLVLIAVVVGRWWLRTPPHAGRQRVPALDRRTTIRAAAVVLAAGAVGAVAGLLTADDGLFALGFRTLTWGCGAAGACLLALAAVHAARGRQRA